MVEIATEDNPINPTLLRGTSTIGHTRADVGADLCVCPCNTAAQNNLLTKQERM
ncbi:hypothetical protein KKE26_06315 [bacterium]|nr:hypothetical protein [bacterium]